MGAIANQIQKPATIIDESGFNRPACRRQVAETCRITVLISNSSYVQHVVYI